MAMELKIGSAFPTSNSSHSMDDDPAIFTDQGIKLVDDVICSMRVAKNFQENTEPINSMDFSRTGNFVVSAAEDDQIIVYNCETGSISRNLKSKKYGVSNIRSTHSPNAVLHSSTKIDDTIRYLSLYDNKYLRYFQGHSNRVTGLSMSPIEDRFLSTSLDKTLRLWDLRSPNCHGMMYLEEKSVASIDPEGLIFGVIVAGESIKLYDLRSFDKGPFSTFRLPSETRTGDWASLKFSPNGKLILLTVYGSNQIRILDAFKGKPLHTLSGHKVTQKNSVVEASFTPDSKYVISGSEDGRIHIWSVESGYKICVLNGAHPRPIQCVQFNPKYMMMASACTDMAFWLPTSPTD